MSAAKSPEPAAGQVWRHRKYASAVFVVDRIEGRRVRWANGGWDPIELVCYECIGIETDHGRVMVGERRRGPYSVPSEVLSIGDRGHAKVTAGMSWAWPKAVDVASWPLLQDRSLP